MAYDADATLTGVEAVQYDGTNLADIQAICRDAREDPTEEKIAIVPVTRARKCMCFIGDWVLSVATGVFIVLDDDSFQAIFDEAA